jgi:hypothetical protein
MKKGVVVDSNDDFVTLLTPDGQFLTTVNKGQEIGEEIVFFPPIDEREEAATRTSLMQARKRSVISYLSSKKAKISTLSLVAIMVIIFTSLPLFQNEKVYAYMSIDINPSFEVSIDEQLRVISLEPMNNEAEQLIKKLPEWKEKKLDQIVDAILEQSKRDGYIYPGKEILITTVINEDDKSLESKLEDNIEEIESSYEEKDMRVETIETDSETREKAQQQGISMGKYVQLIEKKKLEPKKDANQSETSTSDDVENKEKIGTNEEEPASTQNEVQSNTQTNENALQSNQRIKNRLEAETKEKLNETKNKIKENAHSTKQQVKKEKQNWKQEKKQENEARKAIKEREKREKERAKQERKENRKIEKGKEREINGKNS